MIEQYAVCISKTEIGQLAGCRRLLSPEKAARVDRFHFDRDKIRGIIGESMIRYLAETRFGFPGRQLTFAYGERGKPFLTSVAQAMQFNISHAGEWVVCAIGDDPVGIDVEEVKDREISFAASVLTSAEYTRWSSLPEEKKSKAFYQAWTVKESYAKYRGEGLGLEFAGLETLTEENGYSRIAGDPSCFLYTSDLAPEHILTVCAERGHRRELGRPVIRLTAEMLEEYSIRTGFPSA